METKKHLDSFERFVISQVAILIRDNKCLILKDASRDKTPWLLPGGRLDKGELKEESFVRELKEELNFDNVKIIKTVDYDIWYVSYPKLGINKWPVCAIANLIEDNGQKIKLSSEHSELAWISEKEIDDYNFVWPNARRMIKKGFAEYKILNI